MDMIAKIRAEIANHENELEKLRIALSVIELMSGKVVSQKPLITIRGVSAQAPAQIEGKQKRKPSQKFIGKDGKNRSSSIRDAILDALSSSPKNAGELKRALPPALIKGASKNAVSSALHALKAGGSIGKSLDADRRYFLRQEEPVDVIDKVEVA